MKKRIILLFCLKVITAKSQFYLPIEENHLLNCCTPTNAEVQKYPAEKINSVFKYLLDTVKFEYRYFYGACENRAHFISVALTKKGIKCKKIWCFAPVRYSLISQKQMWVSDPLKISDTIKWTYHVAPIVINTKGDTLVIDPSISDKAPIAYKKWLKATNCPEAAYLFTDANWYLFNSLNGFQTYNNFDANEQPADLKLPKWFPNIITGDFMTYEPSTENIPSGLATNDIAMRIYQNEKNTISTEDFKKILGNINNIIAFITNTTNKIITQELKDKYSDLVKKYSEEYTVRKTYWNKTLTDLSK